MTECPLTPQQVQVVKFLADGLSHKHIAREMGLELNTVKTYVERAMRKTKTHRSCAVVAMAIREGWIQ